MAFVVRSFVYNVPAMPKRWSVRVSSRPSRTEAAAPGWSVSREAARRSSCRCACAASPCRPRIPQHRGHIRVQMLREVAQNVASFMELTSLDRREWAEHRADGRGERFRAVDHEEPRPFRIQPALNEVAQQRLDNAAVHRCGLLAGPAPASCPDRIDSDQRNHHRVVAQDDPINQHDREMAIPQWRGEPASQLRRRHGDVATRDRALRRRPRRALIGQRVEAPRVFPRGDPAGHRVHGMRIQRVAVRGEREAGQLDLLPRLTADAGGASSESAAHPA